MMPFPAEPSINWTQVRDLIGDEHDEAQMAVLGEMWREMIVDVRAQWELMTAQEDEAELRRALHGLRGLVAMWGLEEVATWLLDCEKSSAPVAAWRKDATEMAARREQAIAAIELRFPGLACGC